jgi:hypothetical protein
MNQDDQDKNDQDKNDQDKNDQDKNARTNLTDLEVGESDQAKIKGGPKKIFIGGLSVADPSP